MIFINKLQHFPPNFLRTLPDCYSIENLAFIVRAFMPVECFGIRDSKYTIHKNNT